MDEDSQEPADRVSLEAEIEAVLAEFNGDARAAIGALLHDLGVLARDYEGHVSRGYVRGLMPWDVTRRKVVASRD